MASFLLSVMMACVTVRPHSQGWKPLSSTSLAYLWMPQSLDSETWDSGMFLTMLLCLKFGHFKWQKRCAGCMSFLRLLWQSPTNWVAYHSGDIHTLTVLLARSLKWTCQQDWFLGGSEGESVSCPFSPSFRCLQAILGLPHLLDAITPISSLRLFVRISSS